MSSGDSLPIPPIATHRLRYAFELQKCRTYWDLRDLLADRLGSPSMQKGPLARPRGDFPPAPR